MIPLRYRCNECSTSCIISSKKLLLVIANGLRTHKIQVLHCKECRKRGAGA